MAESVDRDPSAAHRARTSGPRAETELMSSLLGSGGRGRCRAAVRSGWNSDASSGETTARRRGPRGSAAGMSTANWAPLPWDARHGSAEPRRATATHRHENGPQPTQRPRNESGTEARRLESLKLEVGQQAENDIESASDDPDVAFTWKDHIRSCDTTATGHLNCSSALCSAKAVGWARRPEANRRRNRQLQSRPCSFRRQTCGTP